MTPIDNAALDTLFVKARPSQMRSVEKLIKNTQDMLTKQVYIEAQLIDVTLNDGYEFGIDWTQLRSRLALNFGSSALELAGTRVDDGELAALRAAAAATPEDMDAQFALAAAALAAGSRDEAADTLLAMIAADREWNEGAARAKLLQIFEAVGLEDEWVVATRRKLSRVLFG